MDALGRSPSGEAEPRPTARASVVCIDDDTVVRQGLVALLDCHEVVETYPDVESFLADPRPCDVVILDLQLRTLGGPHRVHGAHAVAALRSAGFRTLIYTSERRPAVLVGCLSRGASGVVHKSEPIGELAAAITRVASGEVVVTTSLTGLAELVDRQGALPELSPRQREVLSARARGESYRSIAGRLYLSQKTVEEYMSEVARKFAAYLSTHSPADLERTLGLGPGDLLDWRAGEDR